MLKNSIPHNVGAVVLAAGKGTRLGCTDKPKVMLEIGGKPILHYILETLRAAGFRKKQIAVVVGFEANKIKEYFKEQVSYALQEEQLGTGHAAYIGMRSLPPSIDQVLVVSGDDSAFYTVNTLKELIASHIASNSTLSLLTVDVEKPDELGRVIRDGKNFRVLEKEQITEKQKKIKEVSTGTYCFKRAWFEEMFLNMPLIPQLGEYGLNTSTSAVLESGLLMQAIKLEHSDEWFGINTKKQLEEAEQRKYNQLTK